MTTTATTPPPVIDAFPVAALQAGMLYHSSYHEHSSTYHDVLTLRLEGDFRADALASAVDDVVRRHAVLRTGFDLTGFSEPLQVVYENAEPSFAVDDLTGLPADVAERRIADWVTQERRTGFDWNSPPLLRVRVHRTGERHFALSLSFHHAILDGWSVAALVGELLRRYLAHLDGTPIAVTEPDASYRDFVAAELAATDSEETREFWRGVLADAPMTRIPRRPGSADRVGVANDDTVIDAALATALTAIATRLRVPLRTVLLAAHVRVLALLTGSTDVLTGVLTNGRPESGASGEVLGLFLNTVGLRLRLAEDSWAELIGRVFAAETDLVPHRHFPLFEQQRLVNRSPLFDVVFDYRDFGAYHELFGAGRLRILARQHRESTDVPLGVSFVRNQRDGGLHLYLSYQRADFTEQDIAWARAHYLHALAALAADVRAPARATRAHLAEGPSVLPGERPAEERPTTLVEQVLATANITPDAIAVVDGDRTLDYAALLQRAGAVAATLRDAGLGPESVVAVQVPRSADFTVAVLGVLLAGAAVVPLDVDYPVDRLRHSLADSGARVLISRSDVDDRLDHAGTTLLVDEIDPATRPLLAVPVRADDLAYVLYTSGSTGRPKGVALTHGALAGYFRWAAVWYGLGPADRVAQRCPAGFDAALYELMIAWFSGAAAVVVPTDLMGDPDGLADLLESTGVTFLLMVPGLLAAHVDAGTFGKCSALRLVQSAGEALPQALVDAFARQSDARLANFYGPTEGGVGATYRWARPGEPGPTVPIGTTSGSSVAYVLDEFGQVQPVGAPGELYLGGPHLARGYVGAPALTATRFVPDHISGAHGARLYRTGDLVRLLPGDDLEFLGRLDSQVKINGVRVEPTEIEATLHTHPSVAAAAVMVRDNGAGRSVLVAYVVPVPGAERLTGSLRNFLRERLHDAMVPASYVELAELPLLPNGKLDRAALPEPPDRAGTDVVGPRDQVEAWLVELWQDLLGLDTVGIHDDFFALGGHSLTALRLATRIRERFARDLPIATVLAAPTVAELATLVRSDTDLVPTGPVVPMGGSGARWPIFLVHGLGGQVFRFQPLARRLRDDGPVYALAARGFTGQDEPHSTVTAMAEDYARRIRAVQPEGPYVVGGFCIGGNIALEVARCLRAAGCEVPLVAMFWSNAHQPVLAESLNDESTLMMHALAGRELDVDRAELRSRSVDEQLVMIIDAAAAARRLSPSATELDQARGLLRVYRANAHAVGRHRHRPYDGDVALFMPGDDPALAGIGSAGWESVVDGRLAIVPIPGTRSTSVREPLVGTTAGLLVDQLDQARERLAAGAHRPAGRVADREAE